LQKVFTYNLTRLLPNAPIVVDGKETSDTFLHNLILSASGVNSSLSGASWESSVIGLIDTTQSLPPGSSGYLNFTTFKRCFAGTMSNCTGGLTDGLSIEACAPVTHTDRTTGGLDILDGKVTLVNVSSSDVEAGKFPDPFRGQSRGDSESGAWGNRGSEVSGAVVLGGFVVAVLGVW
jgi:hypothetical protein